MVAKIRSQIEFVGQGTRAGITLLSGKYITPGALMSSSYQ